MAPLRRSVGPGFSDEILVLHREVSELFERLSQFDDEAAGSTPHFRPALDIFECGPALMIVVEVPGFSPESIRVTLNRDILTISGERRSARKSGVDGFVCMERPRGRFLRLVRIDRPVDIAKAEASLARGLLTVRLPRLDDRRGREITIPVVREEEERR